MRTERKLDIKVTGLVVVAFLAIMGVCYQIFDHAEDGVFHHIEQVALYFQGLANPEVVTWPAWGYAWLLVVMKSHLYIIVAQSLAGSISLALLLKRLVGAYPHLKVAMVLLALLAIPWHNQQMAMYPTGLAGSLNVFALLCCERALVSASFVPAVAAGIFAGASQNFRTEFFLLPIFLTACLVLTSTTIEQALARLRICSIYVGVAILCQLPWCSFYNSHTGRVSFTESNLGHVLYVSLGSHPRNPWGNRGDDHAAAEAVKELGFAFSSLSDKGSQVLLRRVWQDCRDHPMGFLQRTLHQLRKSAFSPFNFGEPRLDKLGQLHLDVLREETKCLFGLGVNQREIETYRAEKLLAAAEKNWHAVLALLYQVLSTAVGGIVLALGLTGIWLVLLKNELRTNPLVVILGATFLYKLAQDVLLCYQVNYLNNVFPLLIPFVAISAKAIVAKGRGLLLAHSVKLPGDLR